MPGSEDGVFKPGRTRGIRFEAMPVSGQEEISEYAAVEFFGDMKFKAEDEKGNEIIMEAASRAGGSGNGTAPLELFLASLGGCIGVNTMVVLQEMGIRYESFHATVRGYRKGSIPRVFKRIDVSIRIGGDLEERDVKKALTTVITSRCPLSVLVGSAVKLTWNYELVPRQGP
jgi:putative redox protein